MPDAPAYRITKAAGSPELAGITERLLAMLPSWFGIPESNAEYVAAATRLSGYVAHSGAVPIGILLQERHFPESAEIHLLAVDPTCHRKGVGRALVGALIDELRPTGCRLLQVKTLGPSRPDAGYARTRAFYRAVGFLPVEELPDLWPGNPCLVMVRSLG
ncbi:MAG TPA: N-acetyltransferase [Pseudonocardiaceae bacterium]|jgi:GNAT superfamily N-acetyltransferase|nr:N-acetyltransferase [Pseudonocardiaceae bacterium]